MRVPQRIGDSSSLVKEQVRNDLGANAGQAGSGTPFYAFSLLQRTTGWLARLASIGVLALPAVGCVTLPRADRVDAALEKAVAPVVELPEAVVEAAKPSNDRDWSPDQAVLPYAEFHGDSVTVHNIRNCTYRTAEDYTVDHYDRTYDLSKIETLDYVVTPFLNTPSLAHLAMSFGFEDDEYLGVSVEIRKEKGEQYAPLKGVLRQFELMYVVADERDLIRLCTDHYLNGVYIYRAKASPEEVRAMFVDVMTRTNDLALHPEFYNTFTNNCTTNIVKHLNRTSRFHVPYGKGILFPGYFDRMVYDLGLIDNDVSFEQLKLRSRVNRRVYFHADNPDFSAAIRR